MRVLLSALLAGAAVAALLAPGAAVLRVRTVLSGGSGLSGGSVPSGGSGLVGGSGLSGSPVSSAGAGRSGGAAGRRRRERRVPAGGLVVLGPVAGVLAVGAGPLAGVLSGVAGIVVVRWRRARTVAAARARERARAVEACAALSAELRAGRSPAQALEVAAGLACGPSRAALVSAAAAAGLGGDVAGALRPDVEGRTAVPEVLRALSACWTVCAGSGSGLAAAIERLEEGLRADQDQRRAVAAELAGPRATAGMLAVLPLAGLLLAAGLGADPLQVLLHTPLGGTCLVVGLALDGLGLLWTGRLVARAGGSG